MKLSNHVQLIGHVGQDPVIHLLEDGRKLARLSLATHEHITTPQGDRIEKTYWHSIVFWNRLAELVEQYVFQGSMLAIEGKLVTRSWEDTSGMKNYRTEVVGRELLFLSPKAEQSEES